MTLGAAGTNIGSMSLRLRLVLGLVALLVLGLGAFGIATYSVYAPSQYQRLDDQLKTSLPFATLAALQHRGHSRAAPGSGPTGTSRAAALGATSDPDDMSGDGTAQRQRRSRRPGPHDATSARNLRRAADRRAGRCAAAPNTSAPAPLGPKLPSPLGVVPAKGRLPHDRARRRATAPGRCCSRRRLGPAGRTHRHRRPDLGCHGRAPPAAAHRAGRRRRPARRPLDSGPGWSCDVACDRSRRWRRRPARSPPATCRSGSRPKADPTEVAELGKALDTMLSDIEDAFAEREENEQRLRRFLADASHELRTPLTSIQGFAELFRLGDRQRAHRPGHDRAAHRGRGWPHGIARRGPAAACTARPRARTSARPARSRRTGGRCVQRRRRHGTGPPGHPHAPGPLDVNGDVNHLRQAIANLVTNAIRHTPSGSPIEVSAAGSERHGRGLGPRPRARARRGGARTRLRPFLAGATPLGPAPAPARDSPSCPPSRASTAESVEAANAEGGGAVFSLRIPVAGGDRPVDNGGAGGAARSATPPQTRRERTTGSQTT